jgi:hypothetical protein
MRAANAVASCPNDGCPLVPFAAVKAPLGYTIALHGCRYCNFDHVVAVATDATGRTRPVARWSYDADARLYVLVEYGRSPPRWLELTCSAIPQKQQREPT